MKPTRKTQPHRRDARVMEQGPSLAAMLRGAGAMGNPQDVKRATAKRWAKQGAVNGGVPDGSPFDAPGLPQHSGASGMLAAHLAAVPTRRNVPGGSNAKGKDGLGWPGERHPHKPFVPGKYWDPGFRTHEDSRKRKYRRA